MSEKILVVDDEPIVCRGLEKMLQFAGFDVDTVLSGQEAIEKTKQADYGLVFVDLCMPTMDGIQTCKELRKINADVSIVSMTGNLAEDPISKEVEFSNAGGTTHYLYKPFIQDEILEVVQKELNM